MTTTIEPTKKPWEIRRDEEKAVRRVHINELKEYAGKLMGKFMADPPQATGTDGVLVDLQDWRRIKTDGVDCVNPAVHIECAQTIDGIRPALSLRASNHPRHLTHYHCTGIFYDRFPHITNGSPSYWTGKSDDACAVNFAITTKPMHAAHRVALHVVAPYVFNLKKINARINEANAYEDQCRSLLRRVCAHADPGRIRIDEQYPESHQATMMGASQDKAYGTVTASKGTVTLELSNVHAEEACQIMAMVTGRPVLNHQLTAARNALHDLLAIVEDEYADDQANIPHDDLPTWQRAIDAGNRVMEGGAS